MGSSIQKSNLAWNVIFICWIISLVATLGSLFFSEVMEFVPCTMCWYQRICMYPLVIIFLIAMFPVDKKVFNYAMPFVVIGAVFASWQMLLYYEIIPESAQPCAQGVSCTIEYIDWFGFITIPFLSLVAFFIIFVLLIFLKRKSFS